MLSRLGHVLGVVALGEQTAVHHGMQRLHAAVHHLGELRHLVDGSYGNAALGDGTRRAARRDELRPELVMQGARELDNSRLVRHGHENALDFGICHLDTAFPS